MTIKISSDSTCDLPQEWLDAHQVEILPLYTIKEGNTYRDKVDIMPQEIFDHVAAGGDLCTTAALNIDDYMEAFSRLSAENDAVIHINLSAEFSSCYQNACIAAQEFTNVYVVDSRNLSTGHGLVVCEAVRLRDEGVLSSADLAESLREFTGRVEASFVLNQLEYLRRGGRCSTIAALGANLLSLRPCIEVQDGKMSVGKKYRGKFQKCVVEYVKDRLTGRDDICYDQICLTHTTMEDGIVDAVREAIEACGSFAEITESEAGCTISCHCGPSTIGILFVRSK